MCSKTTWLSFLRICPSFYLGPFTSYNLVKLDQNRYSKFLVNFNFEFWFYERLKKIRLQSTPQTDIKSKQHFFWTQQSSKRKFPLKNFNTNFLKPLSILHLLLCKLLHLKAVIPIGTNSKGQKINKCDAGIHGNVPGAGQGQARPCRWLIAWPLSTNYE